MLTQILFAKKNCTKSESPILVCGFWLFQLLKKVAISGELFEYIIYLNGKFGKPSTSNRNGFTGNMFSFSLACF